MKEYFVLQRLSNFLLHGTESFTGLGVIGDPILNIGTCFKTYFYNSLNALSISLRPSVS